MGRVVLRGTDGQRGFRGRVALQLVLLRVSHFGVVLVCRGTSMSRCGSICTSALNSGGSESAR